MGKTSSARRRYLFWLVLLAVVLVGGYWLNRAEPESDKAPAATPSAKAGSEQEARDTTSRSIATNENAQITPTDTPRIYDCSSGFDTMLAQYRPALAAQLKALDAQQKFIDAAGPFTGSFGDPVQLSYPGYESYDLATLASLGDNGDQVANVIYAARQLGNIQQYTSADRGFNDAAFAEHFSRLHRALEAGQVGALQISQYLLRLRALWSSERNQQGAALSNRAAVIELQAWQAATLQAGTLAERVIATVFADSTELGAFQLLNDDERTAVQKRRDDLLNGTLRALTKPISTTEQAAESALKELLLLLQDKDMASARCKDGRSLQQAINETFIND